MRDVPAGNVTGWNPGEPGNLGAEGLAFPVSPRHHGTQALLSTASASSRGGYWSSGITLM
jgi:hypothetical protein